MECEELTTGTPPQCGAGAAEATLCAPADRDVSTTLMRYSVTMAT